MDKLKANEHLKNGSRLEVEIRGCSIEAVARIGREAREILSEQHWTGEVIYPLNTTLITFSIQQLPDVFVDFYLWGLRRKKKEEMEEFPFHKTRCIYY